MASQVSKKLRPKPRKPSSNQPSRAAPADAPSSSKTTDMSYLEGTIGYAIKRAQIAVFQDIYRSFDEHRVTAVEFSVLAVVADNPGINQADLALALDVERPRMVPIINKLEQRGLAVRATFADDGRVRLINLTKPGHQLLAILKERFAKHQARMLERLDMDDATKILRLLWKLVPEASS
ncbi:MarR family winged helix-turn-helix transcriptional regulator [Tardiphaga sp. 215_C5_N2_1]|uniref:MarR family winged helix-turn-helix transcriptional regulator n=1 Tax=Tardiphaga sp. 215_C5_N2_1 TaxID=3240774 RepID=UPI003F8C7DE7